VIANGSEVGAEVVVAGWDPDGVARYARSQNDRKSSDNLHCDFLESYGNVKKMIPLKVLQVAGECEGGECEEEGSSRLAIQTVRPELGCLRGGPIGTSGGDLPYR
jgi:hypothetical protein